MEKNNLFRKSALERLSTPEQLDTLMQVVSPQSWLVLLGLLILVTAGLGWAIFETIPSTLTGQGILIAATSEDAPDTQPFIAEIGGRVGRVLVAQGDYVEVDQALFLIDSGEGGEQTINSPFSGLVVNLNVEDGSRIGQGTLLAELLPIARAFNDDIEVVAYVSIYEAQRIEAGMPVEISPLNVPYQEFGFLQGIVRSVGQFPSNSTLAGSFMVDNVPVIELRIALQSDAAVASGYAWSIGNGPDRPLQVGVAATVNIIVDMQRPIQRILPIFG